MDIEDIATSAPMSNEDAEKKGVSFQPRRGPGAMFAAAVTGYTDHRWLLTLKP